MSKTITNLSALKINYLTSQQYQTALDAGEIDPNELYLTPVPKVDSFNLQVTEKNLIFTPVSKIDSLNLQIVGKNLIFTFS